MKTFIMSHYVGVRFVKFTNFVNQYSVISRNLYIGHRLCKDNSLISNQGFSANNQDILLKSIRSSKDTSDVLHYVGKHYSIMNRSHILQAFKSIFQNQKSDDTSMSNGDVTRSNEFKSLCQILKSRVRSLEVNDAIDVLKTLSYLGVPASSKLTSILLNILASRVNELSLQQIIFLDFLVKDCKSTPIVEALKIALPVVFQANLNVKLDKDNVCQACDLLHYATKKKLSFQTIDTLIDIIMRLRNEINLQSAMSVIRSICDFNNTDESHRPLLHHALDVVLDHISECTFNELDLLLSKCTSKYSRENYFFYHEEFTNAICKFVVNNDSGFEEGVWVLRKLNKLGHVDYKLLDYLANKAETELYNPIGFKASTLFALVKGFALADYKPSNWSKLEPIIVKNTHDTFQDDEEIPWVSYIRDLCTLGTWPLFMIEKLFQPEILDMYMSTNQYVLDQLQILSLYQEVCTLCPEEFKPSPPSHIINAIVDINGKHVTQYPLLAPLQKGLGGISYINTGVYTRLGHFLHHIIVMRKGGYPVPLTIPNTNDTRLFVDDLKISGEHRTVAVMYLPASFYCSNIDKLKGTVRHHLNSISALGLTVVPISATRWEMLLEHEKIPYLMREINEKCDSEDLASASS